MKYLLFIVLLIPAFLYAQTDDKYLAGAVPEVDGKVVFSKTINVSSLSQKDIFDTLLAWAKERFNDDKNRILYQNREEGDIAISGEEYLVFSSTALALDRSLINYRMIFECEGHTCKISVQGIRYEYNVAYQREPERYTAEEWITDSKALSKGKLARVNGKFRTATIDYATLLMDEAAAALGTSALTVAPKAPVVQETIVETPTPSAPANVISESAPSNTFAGFKQITPDKIPGNIIKMLSEDWMLITAGNETSFNMMTASWGGLGYVFGKPVATCFINPTRYTYQLMEKNDTYTLTFYTEAYREALKYCGSTSGKDADKVKGSGLTPITTPSGSKAFGEAWMIIECRKLISQSLSTESISNQELREEWLGKQINKMYIGEIINVWIK